MRDRDALLAEMGLTPRWRVRASPVAEAEQQKRAPAHDDGSDAMAQPDPVPDSREARIRVLDWAALRRAVFDCTECSLHRTRKQPVFGVGDENADWLLVGEAPGSEEDRIGDPFVGQAGKLLDNMLAAIGLGRGENVYIANVLKCRPPSNRNPEPREVALCTPYLQRQIDLIRPKLIIAMGRFAAQTLLNSEATIASLRGQLHQYSGVPLIVTYHPAYLLRNPPDKARAWADLLYARRTMAGL